MLEYPAMATRIAVAVRYGPLKAYLQALDGCPPLQSVVRRWTTSGPLVWLDSARHHAATGRWSLLAHDPWLVLSARGDRIELRTRAASQAWSGHPLEALRQVLQRYGIPALAQPHARALGLVGFLSYELNRWIEAVPARPPAESMPPEMLWFGMRVTVLVDHLQQRSWVVSVVDPHGPQPRADQEAREALERAVAHLSEGPPSVPDPAIAPLLAFLPRAMRSMAGAQSPKSLREFWGRTQERKGVAGVLPRAGGRPACRADTWIGVHGAGRDVAPPARLLRSPGRARGADVQRPPHTRGFAKRSRGVGLHDPAGETPAARPQQAAMALSTVTATSTQAEFEAMVAQALEHIRAGEIFQANIAQRFTAPWPHGSALPLYEALRRINPSPFACFLSTEELTVVSGSPERLVRVQDGRIDTRPIAGTRPRGATPAEDAVNSLDLLLSEKERAEHLMLVDLARSDLGRVCRVGSVAVNELMALEAYSHVMHIVSEICGVLRRGVDAVEVIRAVFPGGTITGCPKVRCMQLLRELEPVPRGLYTGSLGYLGFDGTLDLNIAIRTLVLQGGQLSYHVGAGIVADSQPEREYQETLAKAGALIDALRAVHQRVSLPSAGAALPHKGLSR